MPPPKPRASRASRSQRVDGVGPHARLGQPLRRRLSDVPRDEPPVVPPAKSRRGGNHENPPADSRRACGLGSPRLQRAGQLQRAGLDNAGDGVGEFAVDDVLPCDDRAPPPPSVLAEGKDGKGRFKVAGHGQPFTAQSRVEQVGGAPGRVRPRPRQIRCAGGAQRRVPRPAAGAGPREDQIHKLVEHSSIFAPARCAGRRVHISTGDVPRGLVRRRLRNAAPALLAAVPASPHAGTRRTPTSLRAGREPPAAAIPLSREAPRR